MYAANDNIGVEVTRTHAIIIIDKETYTFDKIMDAKAFIDEYFERKYFRCPLARKMVK